MQSILADVNQEQHAAIVHEGGPLLVVAGAGSGKTRVITCRVAHLVHQGVAPYEITALTFTNKAAREMRERVQRLVAAPDLWVCTFHSFAARTLRRYADRIGYTREYSIYDTEDRSKLIKAILKEQSLDTIRPGEIVNALGRIKNRMGGLDLSSSRSDQIADVIRIYESRMREANAMDFDDLLVNLQKLLDNDEDVRLRLQRRTRWMLVDEYQDTNAIQYHILRALAGSEQNVCATGDPDQSIYRWRGATIRNILDFEKDFPGARRITLDRNYRSTQSILAVANAVIRHNRDRYEKDLKTENEVGKLAAEIRCADDVEEARAVARQAMRWIDDRRPPGGIAVFYRTNAQSRGIERALTERGLPYRIVGSVEFYKRKEVKDLLAYVRLARNPSDIAAFRRVFNVPARKLGKTTEERLINAAIRAGVGPREYLRDRDAVAQFGRARKPLLAFAELLDKIETLDPMEPAEFLDEVVTATAYRAHLGAGTPLAEVGRIENVDELVNAAAEYALREPGAGVDGFLAENALVSDQDALDETANAISLMTVHAAKGLEFPCVVVTGLEEMVFPHALSIETEADVEEERRLFYVAATRAKEELVLTSAARRLRQGQYLPSLPSRFLDEIPDELLDVDDQTRPAQDLFTFDEEPVFDVNGDAHGHAPVAAPSSGSGSSGFSAGDRVKHQHFGSGRVLAVRKAGGTTRITVEFDTSGRRELSMAYARLERLR